MSRLLVLFLGVFLLSGCTVHEYTGHGYHRSHYHSDYREYRYDAYPSRHYQYDRSGYSRHAPPAVVRQERYEQHRGKRNDHPSRHYSQGGDRHNKQNAVRHPVQQRSYHPARSQQHRDRRREW